jgi:hypothetical protein
MPGVDFDYTLPLGRNFGVVLTGSRSLSAGEEDHSTLTYNAAGTATGLNTAQMLAAIAMCEIHFICDLLQA